MGSNRHCWLLCVNLLIQAGEVFICEVFVNLGVGDCGVPQCQHRNQGTLGSKHFNSWTAQMC